MRVGPGVTVLDVVAVRVENVPVPPLIPVAVDDAVAEVFTTEVLEVLVVGTLVDEVVGGAVVVTGVELTVDVTAVDVGVLF